jgi:hypothetical protein
MMPLSSPSDPPYSNNSSAADAVYSDNNPHYSPACNPNDDNSSDKPGEEVGSVIPNHNISLFHPVLICLSILGLICILLAGLIAMFSSSHNAARESQVLLYNLRVDQWNSLYRQSYVHNRVTINSAHNSSVQPMRPEIRPYKFNEQNSDIASFSSLYYSYVGKLFPDTVDAQSNSQRINFFFSEGYNLSLTLPYQRESVSTAVNLAECTEEYKGSWDAEANHCLYSSRIAEICVRIKLNPDDHYSFDYSNITEGVLSTKINQNNMIQTLQPNHFTQSSGDHSSSANPGCIFDPILNDFTLAKYLPLLSSENHHHKNNNNNPNFLSNNRAPLIFLRSSQDPYLYAQVLAHFNQGSPPWFGLSRQEKQLCQFLLLGMAFVLLLGPFVALWRLYCAGNRKILSAGYSSANFVDYYDEELGENSGEDGENENFSANSGENGGNRRKLVDNKRYSGSQNSNAVDSSNTNTEESDLEQENFHNSKEKSPGGSVSRPISPDNQPNSLNGTTEPLNHNISQKLSNNTANYAGSSTRNHPNASKNPAFRLTPPPETDSGFALLPILTSKASSAHKPSSRALQSTTNSPQSKEKPQNITPTGKINPPAQGRSLFGPNNSGHSPSNSNFAVPARRASHSRSNSINSGRYTSQSPCLGKSAGDSSNYHSRSSTPGLSSSSSPALRPHSEPRSLFQSVFEQVKSGLSPLAPPMYDYNPDIEDLEPI